MTTIPNNIVQQYINIVPQIRDKLNNAKIQDANEMETIAIVKKIWAECFGCEEKIVVTNEFSVLGTYCDLAIKVNEKIQIIIYVRAINIELKKIDLRQVIEYATKECIPWVVFTNGISWELHYINLGKCNTNTLAYSFSFLEINPRISNDQQLLFLLSQMSSDNLSNGAHN